MLIKRYQVQVIEPVVKAHLIEQCQPFSWIITANDLPSAWRKFSTKHFGALKPNCADYDISFHSTLTV